MIFVLPEFLRSIHRSAAAGGRGVRVRVRMLGSWLAVAIAVAAIAGSSLAAFAAQPPVANPGGPYKGAAGTAIHFAGGRSSDPAKSPLTFMWSFGDGGTGNTAEPSHVYAGAGTYTLTLTVTNQSGLSGTATTKVTVTGPPQAPVANAGGPYTGVAGTTVSFNGSGSSDPGGLALTYAWSFGDGSTGTGVSPTHKYAAAGTYTATLTVTNTASQSNSSTATVTIAAAPQPPVANAGGPYTGVAGTAVSFNGSGSSDPGGLALTYAWAFGDGTTGTGVSPTHKYAAAGNYTATLTVTNTASLGSSSTAAVTITAAPQPPVANSGGPYTGVPATTISFNGSGSSDPKNEVLTYAWTFGDGTTGTGVSPTHTYAAAGSFTVKLTVTNTDNLSNSSTTTATIKAAPNAPVSNPGGPYTVAAGTALHLSGARSTDPAKSPLTYMWSFGDGVTGNTKEVTHTYAAAGTYTLTLTVTNQSGLSNTATTTVTVTGTGSSLPPVANAGGPYTGTAGVSVGFSGAGSTDPKSETLTYAWSFGDGTNATGVVPTHTYATAGTYTVSLTVTNTDNLSSTKTTTATIAAAPLPPVASVGGPYTGTAGVAVSFSGSGSSDPKNETLTYAWSFGDGGTATGVAPTHTYASSGTYTVSLTVTNTDSLSSSSTTTATIAAAPQPPVANVGGPYTGVAGTAVSFSGAGSIDPKNETLTYAWSFGDGGTGTGVAPSHTYASAGTYTVSLTVTNTDNLSSTKTTTAVITAAPQPPVANAGGTYAGTAGVAVSFSGAGSSDPKNETLTYAWSFGDGGTGTGVAPAHTYASAGTYTVSLTVTNTDSLQSTATTSATIAAPAAQPPVANAGGPYTGTAGVAVMFSGAGSSDPKNETLTYAWSFGDGGTATGVAPTHTYASAGAYTVSLTVTNTDNLSSTKTTSATIAAPAAQPPMANVGGPYTGTAGVAVTFSGASSSDPKGETLSYAWSFGDGGAGPGVAPTHTYASAGTYTVSLTVTNTDNLQSTATTSATIAAPAAQPPVANAGGPYTGTAGVAVAFSGAGSTDPKNETLTYAWSFGDGVAGTGAAPSHTYASAGTYTVSLTVTNTDGLSATATATATIAAPAAQPPVSSVGGPYTGTAGVAVAFSGAGSSDPKNETLTYAWSFGDGGTATGVAPSHTYAAAGTYTVSLTVTNTDSLSSTAATTATIAAPAAQPPTANAGGPYTGTAATAVAFSGAGSSDPKNEVLTYAWTFGDGSAGSGPTPSHTYTTAGTYTASLKVTNTDGASSTATATVTIAAVPLPQPIASAGGPYTGTAGTSIAFNGSGSYDPANAAAGASAVALNWNFGDGSTGAGPTPVHTYATAATYTVAVTVTSAGGSTTASTTATIAAGTAAAGTPTANPGGPYTGTAGTAVSFNGTGSSDPNGLALTYFWQFGDGASATVASPAHTYALAGTFSVTLTVSNGTTFAPATTTATIAAGPPPPALIANAGGPYTVAINQPLILDGTKSTNPSGRQLSYMWDFGDGSTGVGAMPSHTYTKQGSYTVSLNVNDGATGNGNATGQVTVTGPPAEKITASAGGPYNDNANHAIVLDASLSSDNLSNPLTYTWAFGDGATGSGVTPLHAYASSGTYTATVTISSGTASATATATVTITPALNVLVTSPVANALFGTNTVTVTGTVSAPNLAVTVNGIAANVSGTSFTATGVSLREGVNLITATATDGNGGVGTGTVSVILDATAPTASITSPQNGAVVSTSSVTVAGLVNDIVTGTIGSTDVTVTVNGLAAKVANRSYDLANVLLTPGPNTITVVATDNVGHSSTTTSTVQYVPPSRQLSLVTLSGNGQSAPVLAVLPQPLVVQLQAADGTPVAGRPVTFTVTRSDGHVEVMPTVSQSLFVVTDANGKASVLFQLGSRTGLGVNQVTASTPGAAGTVLFTADSTAGAPTQIHAVRGENQRGLLGEPLAEAFQVIVADAYANPIAGAMVTYAVVLGDGTLDHQSTTTDSNGKAVATLMLGQQEGVGNYVVNATFTGNMGAQVMFAASGYAAGPVANTRVSGMVLDNANTPIPNATVRLLGTTLSTVSDTSGRFLIAGAPVGIVTLSVDGSTSTRTETFPFLSFVLNDLPGQNNSLNKPIYLPFVDVDNAQTVGGDDPVTLTMKGVPGVAFTIAPHSVTFPDGSMVGKLSLSQVKSDMVPMEPTNGSGPDLIWTLQPAGTRFSVPVQITLPNTQALPPGTVSELYQYDHDLEQFVSSGTAHVSADGSVIVSDAGFGITKAGWGHGPTFPLPANCTLSCPSTQCISNGPAPTGCACDPIFRTGACGSQTNLAICELPGTCHNGVCSGGTKPNNSHCDDGVFCMQPETCQNGSCIGKPIPPVSVPPAQSLTSGNLITFQASFQSIANPVLFFTQRLGLGLSVVPTLTSTANDQAICCESLRQLNVPQDQLDLAAGLTLSSPKIGIPGFSIYVPFFGPQGFYGQLAGSATATATHVTSVCDNQDCWKGTIGLNATLSGGLGLTLNTTGSVGASVSISAGITAKLIIGCREITGTVSSDDVKAQGSVTTPFGFDVQVGPYVFYPSQTLGTVTAPL